MLIWIVLSALFILLGVFLSRYELLYQRRKRREKLRDRLEWIRKIDRS